MLKTQRALPGGATQLSNHLLITANTLIMVRLSKPRCQLYFAQLFRQLPVASLNILKL